MHWLEHRIPPPVVGVLIGAAMWALARATSVLEIQLYLRIATASVFIVAGLTIAALGAVAFRNASTTVNPLRPESTSSMVVSGVYALTRNPMYVGFALVLVGWGAISLRQQHSLGQWSSSHLSRDFRSFQRSGR